MKKITLFIFLCISSVCFSQNLITNGDLETGSISPFSSTSGGVTTPTGGSIFEGTYSLNLGNDFRNVKQNFTSVTNVKYQVSFYFRYVNSGVNAGGETFVSIRDDDGSFTGNGSITLDTGGASVTLPVTTTDWTYFSFTFDTSLTSLMFFVSKNARSGGGVNNAVRFDNISIRPIVTWDGSESTDWSNADNWDTGVIPASGYDVSIPDVTNAPIAAASTEINLHDLSIAETDGLTINGGGTLILSGTSSGNITYNRNLGTSNWYLVGSPVAGETIEDMISNNSFASGTGSNIGLAPYDNTQASASDRWDYQTAASTGSLTSGGGYSVKLASAGDLAFTGTVETSDVGVSIADGTGSGGNAFNLVGNPYASFVAANSNANGTNNLLSINTADLTENTLWFWDQGTGSYDQINQASAAFYVAPGQGFFVSAGGSNTFNFTEAMQSHQSSDSFQRTTNDRPEIILTMTDGALTRNTDIYYIDGTTTGFDNGFDSSMFGGVAHEFSIYTHTVANGNESNLGIQSLPDDDFENMIIPLGINAALGTEIIISAEISNLPDGINVYLEDKNDGSFTQLDIASNFTTTLDSDLNGIGRFYIHTSSQSLSVDDLNLDNISIYNTTSNNLRIVGVRNGTAHVRLYNILGKQVLNTSFLGTGMDDITLPKLRNGLYIVQLETATGKFNKKVIIE